jgi:hypothetical protein
MFISKLTRIVEGYDPYGMHRVNGIKAAYVFFMLCIFNMMLNIPHVYFYYFYIPLTAMTAYVMVERIDDQYKVFTHAMFGTCCVVSLFNLLRPFPLFFLLAVFVSAMLLYIMAIHWKKLPLATVPIILSLAAYSLLYPNLNMNFHMIINNAMTTLLALVIILSSLILFPLSYYYRLWLRAFLFLLEEIIEHINMIREKKPIESLMIKGHTKHMMLFANRLPRSFPAWTILKISLLVHELHIKSSVPQSNITVMNEHELDVFIQELSDFRDAIKHEKLCNMHNIRHSSLLKIIRAWNHLCSIK